MSTPEEQERLKEEAKSLKEKIKVLINIGEAPEKECVVRSLSIYAGMLTETLLEYEEPDIIMEQAFHRISDLLGAEPYAGEVDKELIPLAYDLEHDSEIGRALSRRSAKNLPQGLDDMHEIVIAMVLNDVPEWEKSGYSKEILLLLLIEMAISSITFEMATQDFCDMLIEEFMSKGDGHSTPETLTAISVLAGHYYAIAKKQMKLPENADKCMVNVMVRESLRHNTPGSRDWDSLSASNDMEGKNLSSYLKDLKPNAEEFFDIIGQDDPLARAVSLVKSVGRMVAVMSIEDVGQIHPNVAKAIAKTGLVMGLNYREEVVTA